MARFVLQEEGSGCNMETEKGVHQRPTGMTGRAEEARLDTEEDRVWHWLPGAGVSPSPRLLTPASTSSL